MIFRNWWDPSHSFELPFRPRCLKILKTLEPQFFRNYFCRILLFMVNGVLMLVLLEDTPEHSTHFSRGRFYFRSLLWLGSTISEIRPHFGPKNASTGLFCAYTRAPQATTAGIYKCNEVIYDPSVLLGMFIIFSTR